VTTALVCLRFRGLFNGGSDYMTVHVGLALSAARAAGEAPTWVDGALGWIALQTLLSYGVAGAVKVRSSTWRDGTALAGFVGSDRYAAPAALRACVAKDAHGQVKSNMYFVTSISSRTTRPMHVHLRNVFVRNVSTQGSLETILAPFQEIADTGSLR
jgi:hypothetical protein